MSFKHLAIIVAEPGELGGKCKCGAGVKVWRTSFTFAGGKLHTAERCGLGAVNLAAISNEYDQYEPEGVTVALTVSWIESMEQTGFEL